jgi:hypothetical protein
MHHTKKTPSPPDIQKNGSESGHTRRSTSRKDQRGAKRHSPEYSSEDTKKSKGYSSGKTSSHSQTRRKKRKKSKSHDLEDFKKAKPPTFDGEIKKGEEAKFWLLGLKKYFRVHVYSKNLKAQISIFNMNGKASIWWGDLRNVKGIPEKNLSWKKIEKYFKKKYLSEKYFDGKTNEFYELKLGQLTIDEHINKFLEMMRYVPYIKDGKVNMKQFISGLPQSYQNKIEFDEPNTLEGTVRKEMYFYEQFKNKKNPHEDWKKKNNSGFKKGFKSSIFKNHGKSSRMSLPTRSVYQQNFPSQSGNKPFRSFPSKIDNTKREPLKCWGCGEEHLLRDCPHRQQINKRVYNVQEATKVNDVARSMPQIYASLDNRQDDHQALVVEMEGTISNHPISILIDHSSSLSYVSPQTVEKCKLQQVKHVESWLVQLVTGTKRKVT